MSHHNLTAFFSSTDNSTLLSGGADTNCWLMLIVDTRGQYVARITRKVQSKKQVATTDLGSSYEFFGEGSVSLPKAQPTKETTESEVVEYFDLNVERHEVQNPFSSLDERFDEIEKQKQDGKSKPASAKNFKMNDSPKNDNSAYKDNIFYDLSHPWEARKQNAQEQWLFDKPTMQGLTADDAALSDWQPDKKLIHRAVCQMLSCSLILNTEKFNLHQWVIRHMNSLYDKVFPDPVAFQEWKEFAPSFFVYHFVDPSAPAGIDDEWYYGQVANAMIEQLSPYNNDSYPYIQDYINELTTLIV